MKRVDFTSGLFFTSSLNKPQIGLRINGRKAIMNSDLSFSSCKYSSYLEDEVTVGLVLILELPGRLVSHGG